MKAIGNYILDKDPLGKGQFGVVYRCHLKSDTSKVYACKVIERKKLNTRMFANL
jgi:hypothetical protein